MTPPTTQTLQKDSISQVDRFGVAQVGEGGSTRWPRTFVLEILSLSLLPILHE